MECTVTASDSEPHILLALGLTDRTYVRTDVRGYSAEQDGVGTTRQGRECRGGQSVTLWKRPCGFMEEGWGGERRRRGSVDGTPLDYHESMRRDGHAIA